jgi:hypothetical protein
MLLVTEDLTASQLAQQPSKTAPPIGWHLWHASRWADRLQASFSADATEFDRPSNFCGEIWITENYVTQWGLNSETLGLLETGDGMAVEAAVSLAGVGKHELVGYAQRTFALAEQSTDNLTIEQFQQPCRSILPEIGILPTGQPYFYGAREVVVFDEVLFQINHSARHLGMIEALRGVLFAIPGTASI